MNPIQEKFKKGELSVGTFTQLGSPIAVECLGRTGLDYVLIDTEHCAVGVEFLTAAITAADAAGITPLVRINEISRSAVLQPLDYGAPGTDRPRRGNGGAGRGVGALRQVPPGGQPGLLPHPGRRLGL